VKVESTIDNVPAGLRCIRRAWEAVLCWAFSMVSRTSLRASPWAPFPFSYWKYSTTELRNALATAGVIVCLFVNSLLYLAPWRFAKNGYLQYSGIERPFLPINKPKTINQPIKRTAGVMAFPFLGVWRPSRSGVVPAGDTMLRSCCVSARISDACSP
jgi:hypothetical protein